MSFEVKKSEIRKQVRDAIRLREMNLITDEFLREIAVSAMVWEFTLSLQRKMSAKEEKLQRLSDYDIDDMLFMPDDLFRV